MVIYSLSCLSGCVAREVLTGGTALTQVSWQHPTGAQGVLATEFFSLFGSGRGSVDAS